METDAIVQLIKMAPEEMGCYVRTICLDDDTITRSHIQAGLGPKSKGCLPPDLAGIRVIADPSHRRRTVSNWYWALEKQPVKQCALKDFHAKALANHFGHFQNQIRHMTFDEAKKHFDVPMRHIVGDHSKCGDWCLEKRAEEEKKPSNKPPMFDLCNPRDAHTYEKVKEVHAKATNDVRLDEMLHPYSTQANKSLNMQAAEVAPKFKTYSQTKSLDYRICHVVRGVRL